MGIATLGFPTGEALLPAAGLASLALLGLARSWQLVAALLALGIVAGLLGTARSRALDRAPSPVSVFSPDPTAPRRRDILRDRRFLVFIPSIIAPSAILTAFIFHRRYIAEEKGWSLELLAGSVTTYALVSLATTFATGTLVDRFGAIGLSRFYLIGIAAAGVALATLGGPLLAPIFFGLLGLTAGANTTVLAAILAEIFGTQHLGRIRALAGSLTVVASATTPGTIGLLFDQGVTPAAVGLGFTVYVIGASLLNAAFLRR
jgi:MFS family permease